MSFKYPSSITVMWGASPPHLEAILATEWGIHSVKAVLEGPREDTCFKRLTCDM